MLICRVIALAFHEVHNSSYHPYVLLSQNNIVLRGNWKIRQNQHRHSRLLAEDIVPLNIKLLVGNKCASLGKTCACCQGYKSTGKPLGFCFTSVFSKLIWFYFNTIDLIRGRICDPRTARNLHHIIMLQLYVQNNFMRCWEQCTLLTFRSIFNRGKWCSWKNFKRTDVL